jgi:RimJ/RimL family protein N-acetyltransferase
VTETIERRTGYSHPRRPVYRVREERNRRALEAALADDRPYAAYALGHLEDGLFERSRFWLAEGPEGTGLVMHATPMGATTVVAGEPAAVEAILSLHPGPRRCYLSTAAPGHLDALRRTYDVRDALRMMRMTVMAGAFKPVGEDMRRLHGRDVRRINRLYASEGGPSHYAAEVIDRAVYYGAFDGTRLVSVAGTHIVAPNLGIGIVGNVFTDREYRGLGLAKRVTSAVTADLLQRGCQEVTLTVDPENTPAVRAYRRLGYEPGAAVVEARLRRRDAFGLGAALRRWDARRRAGPEQPGIVIVHGRPAGGTGGRGQQPREDSR